MDTNNTILIVDDEASVRDVFQQAFERAGYTVRSVEDGEQALETLDEDPIRVMFLDLKLNGMNGMELCKRIRMKQPEAVVYAITGFASEFELSDCCDVGFNGYFLKPVKIEDLYKAAHEAFKELAKSSR